VAHVELSLSELTEPGAERAGGVPAGGLGGARGGGSLSLWSFTAEVAQEPCVVLDTNGVVAAASPGCAALLGFDPVAAVGQRLVAGLLRLYDFNPVSAELAAWEVDKIPPLLALTSGGLARGLLRVPGPDGSLTTVDAVSVPLRDGDGVVGSLTFFAPVGH
jgi:hypothetical protein